MYILPRTYFAFFTSAWPRWAILAFLNCAKEDAPQGEVPKDRRSSCVPIYVASSLAQFTTFENMHPLAQQQVLSFFELNRGLLFLSCATPGNIKPLSSLFRHCRSTISLDQQCSLSDSMARERIALRNKCSEGKRRGILFDDVRLCVSLCWTLLHHLCLFLECYEHQVRSYELCLMKEPCTVRGNVTYT